MVRRLKVGESYIWNAAAIARLGKESDATPARQLGIGVKTVGRRRHELGIRPYRQPRTKKEGRCVVCGTTFEVYAGVSTMRRTCPPSAPCAELLRDATRALRVPSFAKQLRRIPGYRFLDPLED